MPPAPRGPPQKLTPQQFTYFCLGLPIGFIAVTVGLVGLVVVWGEWSEPSTGSPSLTTALSLLKRAQQAPAAADLAHNHTHTLCAATNTRRCGAEADDLQHRLCKPLAAGGAAQPLCAGVHAQLRGHRYSWFWGDTGCTGGPLSSCRRASTSILSVLDVLMERGTRRTQTASRLPAATPLPSTHTACSVGAVRVCAYRFRLQHRSAAGAQTSSEGGCCGHRNATSGSRVLPPRLNPGVCVCHTAGRGAAAAATTTAAAWGPATAAAVAPREQKGAVDVHRGALSMHVCLFCPRQPMMCLVCA